MTNELISTYRNVGNYTIEALKKALAELTISAYKTEDVPLKIYF